MSQKKAKQLRQRVRKETGLDKNEKTSYSMIKHKIKEFINPGENPRFFNTHICEGLRGEYRKAKKGA